MRSLLILYKKELKPFFLSPFGWVVLAFIMLLQGLSMSSILEKFNQQAVDGNLLMHSLSTPMFVIYFLFLFPLITMKQFAEEERSGTLETLMTAPIRTWQVVLAKYLSSLTYYCWLWIPVFLQLKIFSWITNTPVPTSSAQMLSAFTILFLIGTFFVAVGCLASSLTSSQIIAAIITFGILAFHFFLGFIPSVVGEDFVGAELFHYIAFNEHIAYFARGLVDIRPFVYYLSMALFTLLLTHHLVDYRRWKN